MRRVPVFFVFNCTGSVRYRNNYIQLYCHIILINRFDNDAGYSDLQFIVKFTVDAVAHLCELQLQHRLMSRFLG